MAQWLRTYTALPEDPSLVPSAHTRGSQSPVTPAPGDPIPASDLHGQLHVHACTHFEYIFKVYRRMTIFCKGLEHLDLGIFWDPGTNSSGILKHKCMYGWEGRALIHCIGGNQLGNCRASMVSLQSLGQTFKQDSGSLVDFLLCQESNSSTLGDLHIVWLGPLDYLGQISFKANERWPLVTSTKSFHGNIQVCGIRNNWCQESHPVASILQPFRSDVHGCM